MKRVFGNIKRLTFKLKKEIKLYRLVLKDDRTPLIAKVLLWMAIGYLLLPFDIIPDFIPVLGQIDDFIIVPALIYAALLIIPKNLIEEYRQILIDKQQIQ